jgi:hypothetical protein
VFVISEASPLLFLSFLQVPFVLVDGGRWPHSDFVVVNMDGSRHPLPLTTVFHQLQPITASPYTFLQALFGHEYPVSFQILMFLDVHTKKNGFFRCIEKSLLVFILQFHLFWAFCDIVSFMENV